MEAVTCNYYLLRMLILLWLVVESKLDHTCSKGEKYDILFQLSLQV